MGLDNGITIKNVSELPKFADENGDVLYWRKCWGLRDAILGVLDPKGLKDAKYNVDAEDIPAIIRALLPFLSKDHWDISSESVWEYEEMLDILLKDIENLIRLKIWMEEHPDAEVEFYDSY